MKSVYLFLRKRCFITIYTVRHKLSVTLIFSEGAFQVKYLQNQHSICKGLYLTPIPDLLGLSEWHLTLLLKFDGVLSWGMPLKVVQPIPICSPLSWYRHEKKLDLYRKNVPEKFLSTQCLNDSYRQIQEKLFACLFNTTFSLCTCNMQFFKLPYLFMCSRYLSEYFRLTMVLELSNMKISFNTV